MIRAVGEDRISLIKKAIDDGLSFNQCAERLGIHKSTLKQWLTLRDRHDLIAALRSNPYPHHTTAKEMRRRILFFREAQAMKRPLTELTKSMGFSHGHLSKMRKRIGDLDLAWEDFKEAA